MNNIFGVAVIIIWRMRMMVALNCPSCGAKFFIDDSREFGFCSYCGTKIQLVQKIKVMHSFENAIDMDFVSVRRLIDAEMYYDAQKKLKEITQKHPDNADAWIFLAYVESIDFKNGVFHPYINTIEEEKDYIFNRFDNSIGITNAKRLMGNKNSPLYNELKNKYESSVKELFAKIETTTKQLIQDLNDNIFLLDGFFYDEEADGCNSAFFRSRQNLMCHYRGAYYIVNSVNNGLVSMSFDSYEYYYPNLGYRNERHLSWKIDSMNSNSVHFSGIGPCYRPYRKRDTTGYYIGYENMLNSRRERRNCIYCGGKKGLFGCKNSCMSGLF